MKNYVVRLTGLSPYSQSKPHQVPKLDRETAEDYEARTWKNRMHVNDQGEIFIPAQALKNCLAEAAKYLSMQVPGKGKSTYTKNFEAGILILANAVAHHPSGDPLLATDCMERDLSTFKDSSNKKEHAEGNKPPFVFGDWIFTPSDGVPGSGKRVWRCYPVIAPGWTADFVISVVDDLITKSVLESHLMTAGMLIGLGRFRVRNRGTYGRFTSEIVDTQDLELTA